MEHWYSSYESCETVQEINKLEHRVVENAFGAVY